jgi:hypothetical protein
MPNPPYVYNGNLWQGSQWYSGAGAPSGSTGKNGDFYLRTDTDQVYTKTSGTWTVTQDLTGYVGSRGDLGYTGSRGYTGSIGFTGSASTVQGPQGYTGSQGDLGYTGSFGYRGFTGSRGLQGTVGFTGSQGIKGDTGYVGSTGTSITVKGSYAVPGDLPIPYTGAVGDAYVVVSNGELYTWSGTAWIDVGRITGYTGSRGSVGFTGSQGNIGYTGSSTAASNTPFTPYGTIVSTTVQGAIEEVELKKATAANPSFTGTMTYGGVTLTNSVTGVGKMVLDTGPTISTATISGYTETALAPVSVGSGTTTISDAILNSGTVLRYTLTASQATTFTMPTATAGKSFVMLLKQPSSGAVGTATFTGVVWGQSGTPTITATLGKLDILTFIADGTNWYGSVNQGFTY